MIKFAREMLPFIGGSERLKTSLHGASMNDEP